MKLVLCEEVEEKDSGKEREDETEEILAVCAYNTYIDTQTRHTCTCISTHSKR